MQLRKYTPSDCAQMAELFYQTVHSVNAQDYTREQLDACVYKMRFSFTKRDSWVTNGTLALHFTFFTFSITLL